jgi:hypothetical protein
MVSVKLRIHERAYVFNSFGIHVRATEGPLCRDYGLATVRHSTLTTGSNSGWTAISESGLFSCRRTRLVHSSCQLAQNHDYSAPG